jgi:hypothetical protein
MLCLSYYLLCFLFNRAGEQKGRTDSAWKWAVVAQTMYTLVSKCKNGKILKNEVDCLPSKSKALRSNPSTAKKKKKNYLQGM